MIRKEEYTTQEVAERTDLSVRQVRKIAAQLSETKPETVLYKDGMNGWRIHDMLLPVFKRQRKRKRRLPRSSGYYSLTIDPNTPISERDIHELIGYAVRGMGYKDVEIHYTIEQGLVNKHNHVHAYYKSEDRSQFIQLLKSVFSEMNYYQQEIHDLKGWIDYITKTGVSITTIKNERL